MIQVQLQHISKSWGDENVLGDISFTIPYGERIGLVGVNGSGKSTLLSILAGVTPADGGNIFMPINVSSAYLRQNPLSDNELGAIHPDTLSDDTLKYMRLLRLLVDRDSNLTTLSGGERTKLALSLLLAERPKLLLLDEPTNNMDFEGTRALIKLLQSYAGTILIVSHDRYFLDQLVSRVLEIENGCMEEYAGNYSNYRDRKAQILSERLHRYEDGRKEQKRIQETIKHVKQWSDKAHRDATKKDPSGQKMGLKEYKRDKAKKMDQKVKNDTRRLKRLVTAGEPRPQTERNVRFSIAADVSHGRRVLQATGISKSFGSGLLFSESHFSIARGERVALFGPNGCGKSTLLQMILGCQAPDTGELWISPSCEPYVLPQTFTGFSQMITAQQYLLDTVGHLSGFDRALLANMGITKRHLEQKLPTLSFGEQMKIKLAEPILSQKDLLLLDEPTNHLDLHMRETLENTLAEYTGTLLLVSHDLYFLKKICNKVLVWEDREIRRLEYTFEEYLKKADLQNEE